MRKMNVKRVVAMLSALVLVATAVNVAPFKDSLNTVAEAADTWGGAFGSTAGVSTSSTTAPNGAFCISGDSTGVRIYLAKDYVVFGNDENSSMMYENVGITEERTKELHDYRKYALYELSANSGGTSSALNINFDASNAGLSMVTFTGNGYELSEVPRNQILSKKFPAGVSGYNHNPSFTQLTGNDSSFEYIGSFLDRKNFDGLANWANEQFKDLITEDGDSTKLDTLLANYKNILGEEAYARAGYPVDAYAFEEGNWCWVVEPLGLAGVKGKANSAFAISYQDYVWNDAQEQGQWQATMEKYNKTAVEWGFNDKRMQDFKQFYADFEVPDLFSAEQGIMLNKRVTGTGDTAGFAVYGTFNGVNRLRSGELRASNNFVVSNAEPYKYRSVCDDEEAVIESPSKVDGSAVLGAPTVISNLPDDRANLGMNDLNMYAMQWFGSRKAIISAAGTLNPDELEFMREDGEILKNLKLFAYSDADNSWVFTGDMKEANATLVDTEYQIDEKYFNVATGRVNDDETLLSIASGVTVGDESSVTEYTDNDYYVRSFFVTQVDVEGMNGHSLEELKMDIAADKIKFTAEPSTNLTVGNIDVVGVTNFFAGDMFRSKLITEGMRTDLAEGERYVGTGAASIIPTTRDDTSDRVFGDMSHLFWVDYSKENALDYTPTGDNVDDILANMSIHALANSNLSYRKNVNGNKIAGDAIIGVSIEEVIKAQRVTTYMAYGCRDEQGNVLIDKAVNKDGVVETKEVRQNTYEILDNDITDFNRRAGRIFEVEARSRDNTACMVIAVPNSMRGAEQYNIGTVGQAKFFNDFFAHLDSMGDRLNTEVGMSVASDVLAKMFGEEAVSNILLKAVADYDSALPTRIIPSAWGNEDGILDGYSIFVISDSRVSEAPEVAAKLEAWEVNYIYPTILGDTPIDLIRCYVDNTNGIEISKTTEYNGDIINLNNVNKLQLLYDTTATNNVFAIESADPKFMDYNILPSVTENGTRKYATLTHMLNLTRKAFNDPLVASSMAHRDMTMYSDEYLSALGVTMGTRGETRQGTVGETYEVGKLRDIFRWSASDGLVFESNGQQIDVTPFSDGQSQFSAGYNLTSVARSYRPNDRSESRLDDKIITDSVIKAQDSSLTYKMVTVDSYEEILNFYPEYKMTSSSATITDTAVGSPVSSSILYMVSEKERKVEAAAMYYMGVTNSAVPFSGKTISDTIATGTNASNLSASFGNLPVIYAGGNINLTAEAGFGVDLGGFVLDQIDADIDKGIALVGENGDNYAYGDIIADESNIKDIWGNGTYDAVKNYNAWVADVKDSLAVEMKLTTWNGSHAVKTYSGYNTQLGKIDGGNVERINTYVLNFAGGEVVKNNAYNKLMQAVARKYFQTDAPTAEQIAKAEEYFNQSAIFSSIVTAIESNTDADNGSETVNNSVFNGKKWYDEEVRSFVIREFVTTPLTVKNILVSDKVDINAGPNQTGSTASSLFSRGYKATWGATVYLKGGLASNPSMVEYNPMTGNVQAAVDSGSILAYNLNVAGAEFVVPDATTSDMR